MKEAFVHYIHRLQDEICTAIEKADGTATFREDVWEREGGGGGKSRIIQQGKVIEKGGVNTSVVYGLLPEMMQQQLGVSSGNFFACGLSLVIHPLNPKAPTVHANFRYFELYDTHGSIIDSWFGGGLDLTPYYLEEEDAIHFHTVQKNCCDLFHPDFYPRFKKQCDLYFYNAHRGEARGIGGLFFDYLRASEAPPSVNWFDFVTTVGETFIPAYLPILEKRKNLPFTPEEKYWQEIRRGRYVEFNLIHDKGTLFGLKTNGRIESILMSLPPTVRWDYDFQPQPGSAEAHLLSILTQPKDWVIF